MLLSSQLRDLFSMSGRPCILSCLESVVPKRLTLHRPHFTQLPPCFQPQPLSWNSIAFSARCFANSVDQVSFSMASTTPKLPVPHAELVKHITKHPDVPLTEVIEPYRKYEAHLRQAYAQDPTNELIKDPYANVLPLFTDDTPNIKIRARNLDAESEEEKSRYIMSLPDDIRRVDGTPAVVPQLKDFRRNFGVFSESSLAELNWSNVVAAGSSVVNCLLPVPDEYNTTKRGLREFYHEKFSPASDVDLFLYGLTEEEAIEKIKDIETRVRDVLLTETTTVRTKHAITICSQYPTRHIQIVLRIYSSVSEILTGFDIDCSGAAYDGNQVYVTPRALQSYMTQINHVDLTRRSPSYENRLSKYSHRGFEVYWPDLDRSRVDPTIFERSFQRTLGLARLLVLERLPTSTSRESYIDERREERGRPRLDRYNRFYRSLHGDIKQRYEDEIADWVNEEEVSNYHTFTIPYGQKFHAKKIEKLCYTRDLLLNAEWNQPDDREVYLHRHPAFFGRVEDVVNDCCGYCPVPKTDEEKEVAERESKIYVSGKISFIRDDPGRQQIGSFNPLTEDDWTEMAYVGNTAQLCQAIVDGDAEHVEDWLAQEGANPDTRDFTGRTPLHLAVMSSTPQIVKLLVDAGARLVARLADGRTALHLAAARGHVEMVKILMDKSIANEAEFEDKKDQRRKAKRSESQLSEAEEQNKAEEDDEDSDVEMVDDGESDIEVRSMATGSFVEVKDKKEKGSNEDPALDDEDEPNFFDVNVVAWDTPSSALHLAIIGGHEEVVKLLCQEYGADVLLPVKFLNAQRNPQGSLLTLVLALALPIEKAKSMAKTLLSLGATCAQADVKGDTAFQSYVEANAKSLLRTLLESDKTGSKSAINHVMVPEYGTIQTPLHVALRQGNLDLVLELLEHGAAAQVDFESWLKSARQSAISDHLRSFDDNQKRFKTSVEQPLIAALLSPIPESALLLLERGADPNVITMKSHCNMSNTWSSYPGQSALDVVTEQLEALRGYKGEREAGPPTRPTLPEGIDTYLSRFQEGTYQYWAVCHDISATRSTYDKEVKSYEEQLAQPRAAQPGLAEKQEAIKRAISTMEKIETVMREKGAKTFSELYPDYKPQYPANNNYNYTRYGMAESKKSVPYEYKFDFHSVTDVTKARHAAYLELFEAAWSGDLEKIKTLTLTSWDEEKSEAPLKIAVKDTYGNNPFSLAFFRGHFDVAKSILEIAQAQYSPKEKPKTRFTMDGGDESEEYSDDEDADSSHSNESEPRIYSQIVGGEFTIENVGQVSMKVNSRTKPMDLLTWACRGPFERSESSKIDAPVFAGSPFDIAIESNNMKHLQLLLDLAEHYTSQKLDDEDEVRGFYTFPDNSFELAISRGRTGLLTEIIRRTGAGLPLESLVQQSGVELKVKPRYYQGLTVYGQKRKDWAEAGREVSRRSTGIQTSPLLLAALSGSLESVEWFLTDIPMRHYLDFAKSKAAREDLRLKHLERTTKGGVERVISNWLSDGNELVLHAAVMAQPSKEATNLVSYLVKNCPDLINMKSVEHKTPLMVAATLGRVDVAKVLIDAGADQTIRDNTWGNLLHSALHFSPTVNQFRRLLRLLKPELVDCMFKQRSSLDKQGRTPLHMWIGSAVLNNWSQAYDNEEGLKMLKFLLKISPEAASSALRMLDAAGDTPLHSLMLKDSPQALVFARGIIEHDASLLFRENAVGRTPIEVARERYVASRIKAPNTSRYYRDESVANLPRAYLTDFVKSEDEKKDEKTREHEDRSTLAKLWQFCEETLAKFSELPKRQLVSLHEANDVAKRLGEQHMRYRYQFRVQPEAGPDEEKDSDASGSEAEAEAEKKSRSRGSSFVTNHMYSRVNNWSGVDNDDTDGGESSGSE
ncbi:Ankycorbin [Echria macrotheca]|uniref:Ankycorbin n=1 Tax=Echria macrotheca TaxID=438768 RepID=A0AAJ0BCU2_9PEZI|nr:Ankycorbin [Echria macrotheca]